MHSWESGDNSNGVAQVLHWVLLGDVGSKEQVLHPVIEEEHLTHLLVSVSR